MAERPYVLLSCGMSLDGYIDAADGPRLILSNDADLDRVDEVRAGCDAILVGAETVRRDNPRLLVRDPARREGPGPVKVTMTATADLDPSYSFFATGEAEKLVYCPSGVVAAATARLGRLATVVDAGAGIDVGWLAADLHERGVSRLMVEGGGSVHTQFLAAGLADELHLVVAPFFVGDPRAPRFVAGGPFRWDDEHRARLVESRPLGEVVLLRYALSDRCDG